MKNLLYVLIVFFLAMSCRSVEKLVEKGHYDEAIYLAADRLAGKKNKKTKHVKALEKAFWKITDMDMNHIKFLDAETNPYHWKEVLLTLDKIETRQNRIAAFLPLVSKDGYKADFKFVRTTDLKNKALDGAAAYHYDRALDWLNTAEINEDKLLARKAFYEFENVIFYRKDYKQLATQLQNSRELGISHILLDFDTGEYDFLEKRWLTDALKDITQGNSSGFWQKYYTDRDKNLFDYVAIIKINDVLVSPEREIIHHHTDRKKIKDGWEYVKRKNGEIKTDSLGNKIKRDVYRNINARVIEIFREKSALVSSSMKIMNNTNGNSVAQNIFKSETFFDDTAVQYRGDRRAICSNDVNRLKDFPLPFPADMDMLLSAANNLSAQLMSELRALEI